MLSRPVDFLFVITLHWKQHGVRADIFTPGMRFMVDYSARETTPKKSEVPSEPHLYISLFARYHPDRLVGLVVKAPALRAGSNPACAGIFSGSSHTSDLKIGTPVATLPGAWRYRVSTGTGRPGISIL